MSDIHAKSNLFKNIISKLQIIEYVVHTVHHSYDKPVNITMEQCLLIII